MKSELDDLMLENEIDAILVTGSGMHNPAMVYLTGGGSFNSEYIKKRGEPPVLFTWPMERDEAAKTGLTVRSLADYPLHKFLAQAEGNQARAAAMQYGQMLEDLNVSSGRIALYGMADLSQSFAIFSSMQQMLPELALAPFQEEDLLIKARRTKDASEIERIRRMGQATTQVVWNTADFLTGHVVKEGVLIKPDGSPLTIADVKARINLWLAELQAETPEGLIFSIGRDAGVPHSSGNPTDVLRLGQTIVFDIYPCEQGGGYFYDFTRTWCLGHASPEIQKCYDQVLSVYSTILSELKIDQDFSIYQNRACALFSEMGHPTPISHPGTQQGYVHGLGHGIGLAVHERPVSGSKALQAEILVPGSVITIEPGLYYPEKGYGVRIEDSFWVRPDGKFEILAEYPLDLVLPMKAS
jgi:Xaa-Pro aminopeptidase